MRREAFEQIEIAGLVIDFAFVQHLNKKALIRARFAGVTRPLAEISTENNETE